MNIGLDISSLVYDRGVSRYTHNLALGLSQEKGVSLSLFGSSLRQHQQLKRKISRITHVQSKLLHLPPSVLQKIWQYRQPEIQGF